MGEDNMEPAGLIAIAWKNANIRNCLLSYPGIADTSILSSLAFICMIIKQELRLLQSSDCNELNNHKTENDV